MANKRQLKKNIHYACNDLAYACFISEYSINAACDEKFNAILCEIERLKQHALQNASFSFDKTSQDFANLKEYNKAKRAYNAEAYRKFHCDFQSKLQTIVDSLNHELSESLKASADKA